VQKERITDKEAICLFIIFIIGSSLIIGIGNEAKNDAWLAVIAGILMAVPMMLVYCRMLFIFQDKDLFDILNITFGKVIGKLFGAIYCLYAFHLGALVLRNFGEFINSIAMPETPLFLPMLFIGITCIIAARSGIEVMGRTAAFFLPILLFILLVVQLLAIPQFKMNYLKPVMGNGITPVITAGFAAFAFPFAETVLFTGAFSGLKTKKSSYRIYFLGLLIVSFVVIMTTVRNIAVLGNIRDNYYFPSYAAVSAINIGDFIQRIEVTVSFVFVFGALIKTSICLLVAAKGIGRIFNLSNYRSVVIQIGLLMIFFAYTVYDSSMEMKYWVAKVYPYYAFPMQVILPIFIWIFAEARSKKINGKSK
jgi:spore germination protein KB